MSDRHFVVMLPRAVLAVGIANDFICTVAILGFTFFSEELPSMIFYVVFGMFLWIGTYLILKTLRFKVVVKDEEITVYFIMIKPYTFSFNEIVSVVRQIKENQIKSERVVVKTISGKKLIVESSEISYERFLQRIESEVKREYLSGFET